MRQMCSSWGIRLVPCVIGLVASLVFSQTASRITGIISDPTGGVVPNVKVTVTDLQSGVTRTSSSDGSGRYSVLNIPPGNYSVQVEAQGFTTQIRKPVKVEVGQILDLDFKLAVGGMTEKVEVTAEAPLVARSSNELGNLVGSRSVIELPISGRDFARFSLLTPGAVAHSNFITDLTFNGKFSFSNDFTIDGINAGRVDYGFVSNGFERGARLLTGSLETVAEFRVLTSNYSAEFGFADGAKIAVATKSGGNEIHGSLFEYLRNSVLDSRNFFAIGPKPKYILNQFGANIGGPIQKDKTFYFLNYEGSRQRIGVTGNGTVLSRSFRNLVLSTSPALKPLVDTIPLGTAPTANPNVDQYTTTRTSNVREDTGSARVDHYFGTGKDSVFFRHNFNDTRVFGPLFSSYAPGLALDQVQNVPTRTNNFVASEVHTFSPRLVNEFKFGVQRFASQVHQDAPNPLTTITGITITPGTRGLFASNNTSFEWINNVSLTSGRHNIKTGFDIRRIRLNRHTLPIPSMLYASLDDFANNRASSATVVPGQPTLGVRTTQMGYYAQDDIKLTPRFTLNLGLRYEYFTPLSDAQNRTRPFNLVTGTLDPPGSRTTIRTVIIGALGSALPGILPEMARPRFAVAMAFCTRPSPRVGERWCRRTRWPQRPLYAHSFPPFHFRWISF